LRVLLDTCVLAELRQPDGTAAVKSAVAQLLDENLFLSVLTIGEIAKGIALLAPGRKRQSLEAWLTGLETEYGDRILAIDSDTARLWGELTARAQHTGIAIPAVDGLLAATALRHGLHVMTRNTRHFQASGALVLDPWQESATSDS
jgi:toxin FitB